MGVFEGITEPFFINTDEGVVISNSHILNNNNLTERSLMSNIIYNYHYTYIIINTTNQMKYIGVRSCNCLPENDSDYMGSSKILNEAMEVEPEAFTKTIIETFSTREIANTNEQWLHETYDVARNSEFFNLCIAPKKFNMCERTHSDSTKKKMSESAKGRPRSAETRKKLSDSHKGKTFSEETLKKMSDAQRGKKHSLETRKKMSIAQSGENHSQYGKVPWNKGIPHTDEVKEKLRKANSGPNNPNYGKPRSAAALENMRGTRGPQKKTTCPHCLQTGGGSMMKRHHFSNCKEIS